VVPAQLEDRVNPCNFPSECRNVSVACENIDKPRMSTIHWSGLAQCVNDSPTIETIGGYCDATSAG
jgi:hypothetical protein